MAAPNSEYGPSDNQQFYQTWIKTDALYNKLFLSGVNLPPMDDDYTNVYILTMAYLAWYGHHMVIYSGKQVDRIKARVASWADLLGPEISRNKIADQNHARRMLVQAVRALSRAAVFSVVSTATAVTFLQHPGATPEIWTATTGDDNAQLTPEGAMMILSHMASTAQRAFTTRDDSTCIFGNTEKGYYRSFH
ncbi:hypothetical protein WA026_016550 [Henosepilachna vigintioctopunctata]|uniref:Uncharacterized protein n=1 Tax=Henosepilachna vigintioctopunctata TaxID=420089 RepID=A0AAW1VGF0_9CUCU